MCSTAPPSERLHPQDCAEIYKLGIKDSGIYTIQPDLHRPPLEVITHSHTVTLRPALNVCVCVCYLIKSRLHNTKVFVMTQAKCDMETAGGGWTVVQNRHDGSLNFNRTWQEYREGFGSPQGEHWLGNAALHALTSTGQHQLRIELEDWHHQRRHATYNNFKVASETQR